MLQNGDYLVQSFAIWPQTFLKPPLHPGEAMGVCLDTLQPFVGGTMPVLGHEISACI